MRVILTGLWALGLSSVIFAAPLAYAQRITLNHAEGAKWLENSGNDPESTAATRKPDEFRHIVLAMGPSDQSSHSRDAYSPGKIFRDCAYCPEMVVLPAGEYMMGSPETEAGRNEDEGPRHRVRIHRRFAVGKYEVTFAEWNACVSEGGCPKQEVIKGMSHHRYDGVGWGEERQPIINVSWEDAQTYAAWVSRKTGKRYRLLSESEWEYAARAGSASAYPWGEQPGQDKANFEDSGSKWGGKQPAPVGSFTPNAFGLCDMIGNVIEWVQDCYHGSYEGAPADGSAWEESSCDSRVLRNGSWSFTRVEVRSANRDGNSPQMWDPNYGFRVARTLP